ncbi:MAG: hypothetical protein HKK66_11915 [Chlorobiaceae bacterium]|nr:hypothetical protein [Chlorobiaceae bacterium]
MPPSMPDPNLIARSKEFSFILHWHLWHGLYNDELSKRNKMGFGYRCGVFYPNGSRYGYHHDDWPAFFDVVASMGLTMLSIDALFCYWTYPSCRTYIDSLGAKFDFP